jgi:hypothetical protein
MCQGLVWCVRGTTYSPPPNEFITLFFQISAGKFYKCVDLARQHQGRGVAVIHGNTGKVDFVSNTLPRNIQNLMTNHYFQEYAGIGRTQEEMCTAFLYYFSERFCNISGGDLMHWPQGRTQKDVYEHEFRNWLLRSQGKPTGAMPLPYPSMTTFTRALNNARFDHVKMRKEHFHTRCDV